MIKKWLWMALLCGFVFLFVVVERGHCGPSIDFGDNGYLQIDVKFQGIGVYTDYGSGRSGNADRWDLYLRRARLTFTGFINDTWGVKFQTCGGTSDTYQSGSLGYSLSDANSKSNSQIRLVDGYLIGLLSDTFNLKVGETKIPLTRANLDECFSPLSSERSSFVYSPFGIDATKNSRDMGIVASGNFFENHFKYWAAIMEGREGESKFYNKFVDQSFRSSPEPESNFEYVLRLHYSFLNPENSPTAMGYKGTYLGKKGSVFTIGAAGAIEPKAAFRNTAPAGAQGTPGFLDSIVINGDSVDYYAYTADAFLEVPVVGGGDWLTATAMYLKVDFDDAYKTARSVADLNTIVGGIMGQREGWYAKVGYILPQRIMGKGSFQPFARYEDWNLASFSGVNNQNVKEYGVGLNYYVLGTDKVRFTVEYQHDDFDKRTKLGDFLSQKNNLYYNDTNAVTLMFMIVL